LRWRNLALVPTVSCGRPLLRWRGESIYISELDRIVKPLRDLCDGLDRLFKHPQFLS
jgi:hypothetical protein